MLNIVLLDDVITALPGAVTYGEWVSLTNIYTFAYIMDQQGPEDVTSRQAQFASGPSGSGLVSTGTIHNQTLAPGYKSYWPACSIGTAAYINEFGPLFPTVAGSIRIGFKSGGPGNAVVRIVYLGMQDV